MTSTLTYSQKKTVDALVNALTYASELIEYRDSYVYGPEDSIRVRLYTVECPDETVVRLAIFTNDNGEYYAAVRTLTGDWTEFTLLNSTKQCDTIRFNTEEGEHFYADDYILRECGSTPLAAMLLGMIEYTRHIGEGVVYESIKLAKQQGLL